MDFFDKDDIGSDIKRIDDLLSSGIFDVSNAGNPLVRSAFIDTLICLRDLMFKANKYAKRIDFLDDVSIKDDVKDVTSLIKFVRDAICHPDSDNHYVEDGKIRATYNVIYGRGCAVKIGDFEQSSPYDDDVCFFFGSQRIFLQRHIKRALQEAKEQLVPLLRS